ncbi:hypothetical protein ACNPQK_08380 [Acinetobacter guillouiae]|uniref:hypothetical protein n=1 Tax=Acinetobacter guillouiae TaxID=106649 RepID=UPI003AF5A9A2
MKKPRNKKYNPNKLLPSQVKKLQQASQYKKDISETYEMSMEFVSSHVRDFIEDKKLSEKALLTRFANSETLPYHFTIGAYDYQDLSIALILGHVEQPEAWKLSADIHMMNIDDLSKPMITIEFRRDLPSMSHIELLRGKKDCKIDLGYGLKMVGWLGLDQEIIKEIESQKNIPNDFGIEQIQVLIEADIKFINTSCYQEFLAVAEWVNAGHDIAEDRLRKLWIADQVLGGSGKTFGYEGAA